MLVVLIEKFPSCLTAITYKRGSLAQHLETCVVYLQYFNVMFMNIYRAPRQVWKTRHKALFCLNRKCDFL
jgi:hypothetical protein